MFYLKNDDMEELFRKAAENYELDTDKASDWESISKQLGESQLNGTEEKAKKKRRFIFWWFLLFPAGWMAHNTWDKIGKRSIDQKQIALQQQVIKTDNTKEQGVVSLKEVPTVKAAGTSTVVTPTEQTPETSLEQQATEINKVANKENVTRSVQTESKTGYVNNNSNKERASIKPIIYSKQQKSISRRVDEDHTLQAGTIAGDENKNIPDDQNAGTLSSTNYPGYNLLNKVLVQTVDEKKWILPALSTPEHLDWKSVVSNKEIQLPDSSKAKLKSVSLPKDGYLYAQAIVAPDLTNVKFQRISGTGSSVGLLLGYRLNKRVHIEAGGYWEKKQYYTSGEYFDKSKLAYFQHHEIYEVDGDCHMVTIPVNLRYNFISKKNSDWFVTGGVAAYLMQKEYYDITYDYYGERRTRGYSYKDAPKSWLATANIGVGYQSTLWRSFHFRIEPYFRIPVTGVGTGNLSLNSAGIYIGIGRRF